MSPRSAWCWTPDGFTHSAQQHAVCEMRQHEPDARVRIEPCGCEQHGGHENAQKPREIRGFEPGAARMGATEKTAPGGALTPESQGLADWIGVD